MRRFHTGRLQYAGALVGIALGGALGHQWAGLPGAILGAMVGPPVVWLVIGGPGVAWEYVRRRWWAVLVVGAAVVGVMWAR